MKKDEALNCSEIPNNSDTISRQAVTKFLNDWLSCLFENCHKQSASDLKMIIKDFKNLPSVQPELKELSEWKADFKGYINDLNMPKDDYDGIMEYIDEVPSAQPEIIRCKDCKHSRFFDPCFYCYEMGGEINVPENGFCFKAERREK